MSMTSLVAYGAGHLRAVVEVMPRFIAFVAQHLRARFAVFVVLRRCED